MEGGQDMSEEKRRGKLYLVSDVHSFFGAMKKALDKAGFFEDETGTLVILGDALDRGPTTLEMINFLLKLLEEDRLIYIRGNHEDILDDMILSFSNRSYKMKMGDFNHNRTTNTAICIVNMYYDEEAKCHKYYTESDWQYMDYYKITSQPYITADLLRSSTYFKKLFPSLNFYETEHYVFCHGWVPTDVVHENNRDKSVYNPNWRSDDMDWRRARWLNGMEACVKDGAMIPGKTVICGHFHTGWGHENLQGNSKNLTEPFIDYGIIAIDAGVFHGDTDETKKVNCIVIDEDERAIFEGKVIHDPHDNV